MSHKRPSNERTTGGTCAQLCEGKVTMKDNRKSFVVSAVLLLAALGGAACSSGTPKTKTSVARVVVACGVANCPDVARVTVTVSKGDGLPDFTPISQDLTHNGTQWTRRITGIPVGVGRQFDAVAFDSAGAQLFAGGGRSDIVAGSAAVITIVLSVQQPPSENAFPAIDFIAASSDTVQPAGLVLLTSSAHDDNAGDTISNRWSATCGAFDNPGPFPGGLTAPRWTAPSVAGPCEITLTVTDNHGAAVKAALTINVNVAGPTTGDADVNVSFNAWPVVTSVSGNITLGATMVGNLTVVAVDPDADQLTYDWTSTCPALAFDFAAPFSATSPYFSLPGPTDPCTITVTVSSPNLPPGAGTRAAITLPPNRGFLGRCHDVSCQTGQTCDPADGICKMTGLCSGVTCPALDACHVAGICDPATGACSNPPAPVGTGCDDANLCTQTDACDAAGACVGSTPVNCTASDCTTGGICNPANGTCEGGANQQDGTICTADANLCTTERCQGGVCTPQDDCLPSETCAPAVGLCSAPTTAVANKLAKSMNLTSIRGVGMNPAGTAAYLGGSAVFFGGRDVDGISHNGLGASDVYLAKYNPVTGANLWARLYGDEAPAFLNDITTTTQDNSIAVVGRLGLAGRIGDCTAGTPNTCAAGFASNSATYEIDYLLVVDEASGATKIAIPIDDGQSGQLQAVAANPTNNLVALCGYASVVSSITPGQSYAGGQRDIVIAVYNTAGVRQWSRMIGAGGDEQCDAIAIADDGRVFAAGKYSTVLDLGMGALPTLPGTTAVRHIWLAQFSATGTTLQQRAVGVTSPSVTGNLTPYDLALDSAGDLVMVGSFTAQFPPGGASYTAPGAATDVFVAKYQGAGLAQLWQGRLGSTGADLANAVSFAPGNNPVVVGYYSGVAAGTPTSGMHAFTTSGIGTVGNVFVLKLDGATGATQTAAGFGDTAVQQAFRIAIAGSHVVYGGVYSSTVDFGAPTIPLTSGVPIGFATFAEIE